MLDYLGWKFIAIGDLFPVMYVGSEMPVKDAGTSRLLSLLPNCPDTVCRINSIFRPTIMPLCEGLLSTDAK